VRFTHLTMKLALRNLALAACAAGTVTASTATASTATASTATATPTASANGTALNALVLRGGPGVVHVNRVAADSPPTSSQCEQQYHVSCYDPAQLQQAYNLTPLYNRNIDGRGRTIVVVDVYGSPTIGPDLSQFDSAFSLPNPPSLRVIAPAGRIPRYSSSNPDMVAWAGETTLDVEWAHAMAPGANILLVAVPESRNGSFISQAISAENYVAKHHMGDVITQSFGGAEQAGGSIGPLRYAYQTAARNHITVLAATGDTGAANTGPDGKNYYTYPTTSWPATDPLVTAVGGTDLHLYASGNRSSADTAWNDTYNRAVQRFVFNSNGPIPLAAGGGRSAFFGRPSYQNSVRSTTGGNRGIPDISMSGSCAGSVNTYQSYGGQQAGWYAVCGTSEAAPLFAGVVALAAQVAGHPLGQINPALYQLAAQHAAGIVRVTSGNNTVSFYQHGRKYTVRGYSARNGYSRVVGVGTINALYFVPELARLG
jgi:subtilase family serine protease